MIFGRVAARLPLTDAGVRTGELHDTCTQADVQAASREAVRMIEAPGSPDADGNRSADAAVLERLRAGDEAAFRQLVVELTPMLTRLARTYTPTDSAAQDAVQDTWLVVVDKLDSFQGRSTLKTWVCGILVHTARRRGVRESRSVPFSSAWAAGHAPTVDPDRFHGRGPAAGAWRTPPVPWDEIPEDRLAAKELRAVINAAIAGLPARQREVITARDVVGMDAGEAAAILGVSSGNQRVLLHRARSKVRSALEQYGATVLRPPAGSQRKDDAGGRA